MASFSKSSVLEVYSDFINNFTEAMDLAKCESNRKSAFADLLKVGFSCLILFVFIYEYSPERSGKNMGHRK